MVFEQMLIFLQARPFEGFMIRTTDGRESWIRHPEEVQCTEGGESLVITYPGGQVEIIDMGAIISIKTLYAADPQKFIRER